MGDGGISLVDPKDSVTFAHRLEYLLYDEKARENWQKWAKKYIKQFNYPVVVDRYEEIYNELLQERQKA